MYRLNNWLKYKHKSFFGKLLKFDMLALTLVQFYESSFPADFLLPLMVQVAETQIER